MKKNIILLRLFVFFIFNFSFLIFNSAKAQDFSHLRISLLTCSPGEELYATFGHSAFRVVDSSSVTDEVYNYGTFNFDEPNFYIKFMRGKLLYCLSLERFEDFKFFYQSTNRGITEQVLNLSAAEKTTIQHFLNENAKDENKYYKYDFFFDNCTSRLRDILKKYHDSSFCKKYVMPEGTRFRQAIHFYLDKNNQYWSKLGIDILLGAKCDAVMTAAQMQFLPDNLMKSLDSSAATMIQSKEDLYHTNANAEKTLITPSLLFWAICIFIFLLSLIKHKNIVAILNGIDWFLFFITGFVGVLLIFMWTATDHSMCKNNYNLVWALPTHFIMAFFINSKKSWVKKYYGFTTMLMLAFLLAWFFLPQQMNNSLIPIVLLLTYRSFKVAARGKLQETRL